MWYNRRVAVVGSRAYKDYEFLSSILQSLQSDDIVVSGGAVGVDSMAQRWCKENGRSILIHYPDFHRYGSGATFARNRRIVEDSDIILAFYAKGSFQRGGTANTIEWAKKLEKPYQEYEEPGD